MHPSHTIARLAGPVLCVVGLGMLANGGVYREMAGQFLAGYPFIYITGILALVGGLAILNVHHAWTRDWRSAITILGWLMTFGGTFRVFAPQFVNYIGTSILTHSGFFVGAGIVALAFGGFITFKGYAA
jgi:drug/metabolite transporter (DMT)-like permease